jgi:sirohydrochlorin cobaltochelatase
MTPILLVAFGAMSPSARATYAVFEAEVRAAHPGRSILWAYTATSIVARLRAAGETVRTLEEACAELRDQGHHHATACSLHLVPGEKHREIQGCAGLRMRVSEPLLSDPASVQEVADDLLAELPGDRPVLVVAHGHAHKALYNTELEALKARLAGSREDVFLMRLEGDADTTRFEAFVHRARSAGRVHVCPFLMVAGDHVQNDILGDAPDSLKSRLAVPDFTCGEVLGAKPWVRRRFLSRLGAAMEQA